MADTWVTLVGDDLAASMTAKELAGFSSTDATTGVPSRAVVIATDLVAEIRGMIRSQSDNLLPANPALIPPEFKARALAIGRWRLLATIPGYQPGDARKLEYDNAEKFFGRVAEGKIRPQNPDDTPAASGPVQSSGTWNSENKITGRMHPTPRPGPSYSGDYANPNGPADQ